MKELWERLLDYLAGCQGQRWKRKFKPGEIAKTKFEVDKKMKA